ncbi:DotA/TraY family protein [uncultured Pseudodesulfovibrio sp.]|uniref:DotA/TraY family protein n=1 Tax=uncultured Pseudodesulfovibrio sp. TaxID=2035858 RepID=UPI0029C88BC3|nr:DotA/TraY family protein [uncultured Pseudodesulfovibrio sp.]
MATNPYPLPVAPTSGFQTPELAQGDIAARMMDAIFGPGWNTLVPSLSNSSGGNEAVSIVLPILEQLNWICTSVVIILFIWIYGQGLVGTASEGKPLGSKFHTAWVPIRISVALAAIAPVAKGFCLLQLGILWCVGYSINIANWEWFVALDYQEKQVGQIIATLPPEIDEQVNEFAKNIFLIQAQQEYWAAYHSDKYPLPKDIYKRVNTVVLKDEEERKSLRLLWTVPANTRQYEGIGGFVEIPKINDNLMVKQEEAVKSLVRDCAKIAGPFVANEPMDRDAEKLLEEAAYRYKNKLRTFIGEYYKESVPLQKQEAFKAFKKESLYRGWVSAGEYTWTMNGFLEGLNKELNSLPHAVLPFYDFIQAPSEEWNIQMARAKKVTEKAFSMENASVAARGGNSEGIFAPLNRLLASGVIKMSDALTTGDPIVSMSNFGHYIVGGVHAIVTTMLTIEVAAASIKEGSKGWLGRVGNFLTGGGLDGFVAGADKWASRATPLLLLVLGPVYLTALSLAYILPFMPFVIWWGAVLSWLVLVIEAMVAAPLWCVGHAMPEGEGFAGRHGGRGYMLLFGVLLRPALMVLGLIFAMVLTGVVGKFIGRAFEVYINGAMMDPTGYENSMGLAGAIVFIIMIGSFTLYVVHKLYNLINHLPDNVMRWVGFSTVGTTMLGGAEDAVQGGSTKVFGVYNNAATDGVSSDKTSDSAEKEDNRLKKRSQQHFKVGGGSRPR